jgi:predicted aspartyl protease
MPSLSRFAGLCAISIAVALSACAQSPGRTIHMDVIHGKPYVMVTINGKGPFRFVVDTGTGAQALITPALADQLQLPALGQARLIDPSGQGQQRSQILFIQSLNLGGVEFSEVKAILHSFNTDDETCVGLLGFELFRDYLLTLDFPNRSMILAQGVLSPDGEKSVLPFRMPDGVPVVPLSIGSERGNERIEAQLDSGGVGLALPEHLASRLNFASTPVLYANGESLATRFQLKAGKLGSDVHVGRYTFVKPMVEIHPAFPVANLGACAMQHFAITFDQKNLLVRFDSDHEVLHLDSMPTAMRMENSPAPRPADQALIPVG